jgi:hypothetical protein
LLRNMIGAVGLPNVLMMLLMKSASCFASHPRAWRQRVQVSDAACAPLPGRMMARRLRHFVQAAGITAFNPNTGLSGSGMLSGAANGLSWFIGDPPRVR